MGSKLEDLKFKKSNFQPGPGTYETDKTPDNPPRAKFGTSTRIQLSEEKQKYKPGPGTYAGNYRALITDAPNWGFGSGTRTEEPFNKAKKFVPGPGSYLSKTFVGAEGSKITMAANL